MTAKGFVSILILACVCLACNQPTGSIADQSKDTIIHVEYPEVYELANIVLALTDYGQTDKWQVRKDFPYYDTMMIHFEPFMDHPLIDSVNFSRERWMEYLSFRTDAYAFDFDETGSLKRVSDFQSFDVQTFDDHLLLIEDFAEKSGFRAFFQEQASYRDQVTTAYQALYMLDEMRAFLTQEFGDFYSDSKYNVVLSPFVYAQNLHRDIDSLTTADFPSLSTSIVHGLAEMSDEELSRELHTLFTEMDHGYVNPLTNSNQVLIAESFNESIWSKDSGYEGYGNAVFNEYMTWAVYDIFNQIHFPEYAEEVGLYWHFQNTSRGFPYSNLFSEEVQKLYNEKSPDTRIKNLYPAIAEWTKTIEPTLSKPEIRSPADTLRLAFEDKATIDVTFSEPLEKNDSFTVLLRHGSGKQDTLSIGLDNDLRWTEDGSAMSFELDLPSDQERVLLIFNWWGTHKPLRKADGVLLHSPSIIRVANTSY